MSVVKVEGVDSQTLVHACRKNTRGQLFFSKFVRLKKIQI